MNTFARFAIFSEPDIQRLTKLQSKIDIRMTILLPIKNKQLEQWSEICSLEQAKDQIAKNFILLNTYEVLISLIPMKSYSTRFSKAELFQNSINSVIRVKKFNKFTFLDMLPHSPMVLFHYLANKFANISKVH